MFPISSLNQKICFCRIASIINVLKVMGFVHLVEKGVRVSETITVIKQYEDRIENALWSLEVPGQLDEALVEYHAVETDLDALSISPDHPAYSECQRVLAYCLLRQSNILRQLGQTVEAQELGEREMTAARACGDQLTLARSLMSNGTNLIVGGEVERGLSMVEEARNHFETDDNDEFKQGLGWYWVLQADLMNAGLIDGQASEVVIAADQALTILSPLQNWTGVARAYAARAQANESIGDEAAAAEDRQKQGYYEDKVASSDTSNS
jgi:tetratricopeptide (TPR) repeat protein